MDQPTFASGRKNRASRIAQLVDLPLGATEEKPYRGPDFDTVFATLTQLRAAALLLDPDPLFFRHEDLAIRTARLAIPTISFNPDFVTAGGLMSYGNNATEAVRIVGILTIIQ